MVDSASIPSRPVLGTAAGLAPLVGIVFLGFLSVGAPLPALALFVHDDLGFSPLAVGWVIGLQSLATVLTRHRSGVLSDMEGARRAVLLGLPIASAAGLFYLVAAVLPAAPGLRLVPLLLGRVLLGLGESLFLVGTMSWGIGRLGPARTGTVMSWQGIALYAALGAGAPLGLFVQARAGFAGVAVLTVASPLLALLIALRLPGIPAAGGARLPFHRVLGLIWRPGLVLTLATVPFAAMATFLALHFAARTWSGAGLALAGFGAAYVAVRLVGSGWTDRFGAPAVAAASLATEAAGQVLLWLAPGPVLAGAGAVLTGLGFSLVFPAMGVAAASRLRPEQRGQAVGNFIAFFDVALGATGPLVGVAVAGAGTGAAFLAGAACAAAALSLLPALKRMAPAG